MQRKLWPSPRRGRTPKGSRVRSKILAEKLKDDQDFAAKVQRLVDDLQKGGGGRTAFDQRGQTVHGSQTNIAGNVNRPVLSGNFSGPVNTDKSK